MGKLDGSSFKLNLVDEGGLGWKMLDVCSKCLFFQSLSIEELHELGQSSTTRLTGKAGVAVSGWNTS